MGEIRIRDDVEPWLADLLASTIPHSDAVLLQTIQAFGWGSDDHHLRGTSWSISTVLGRLDEWRIIEGLNHHSHAYHPAWRSLTRPPGAWWSWRLDAFRPGMIDGVETLLGEHGEVAQGLHFSFKSDSVARWRTFLAKPRLTLGILAMMPIAFLVTLWLGYVVAGTGAVSEAWLIGGTAAIGFATPAIILFTLASWRKRWRVAEIARAGSARAGSPPMCCSVSSPRRCRGPGGRRWSCCPRSLSPPGAMSRPRVPNPARCGSAAARRPSPSQPFSA